MMNWTDIKALEKRKKDLQLKLDEFLNLNNKEIYNINELKREILVLDKYIDKILCVNDVELKQILNSKGNNTRSFYELKDKYKKISKLKNATAKMINIIESYQKQEEYVTKKI